MNLVNFQENLIKEGLELELENKCLSFDGKTWFLKIHIPWKTEMRLAEVLSMKLPTKRFITISVRAWVRLKIIFIHTFYHYILLSFCTVWFIIESAI